MLNLAPLLRSADLSALLEDAGYKLRGSDHDRRCVCPLHQGKNPQGFSVSLVDDEWLWHCFSGDCGGGNAIQFVQRWKNVDFLEAVTYLATRFGVNRADLNLTPAAMAEEEQRARRSDVLELAARYYLQRRRQQRPRTLLAYLMRERGFDRHTVRRAGYGYSDGLGLEAYLRAQGADMQLAYELGVVRRDGLDFTANREGRTSSPEGWLVYVHRRHGRVVGLSARALNRNIRDKSRNLPGERRVYRAVRARSNGVFLVEGQADADSAWQMGYTAWALCGTASLTADDLYDLRRAKGVYLWLDEDVAPGDSRLHRLGEQIGPLTMVVTAHPCGQKDLNAALQAGMTPADMDMARQTARSYLELCIDLATSAVAYEADEQVARVVALLAALPESARPRWVNRAAKALDLPAKDLREQVKTAQQTSAENSLARAEVREGCLMFDGVRLLNGALAITKQLTQHDGINPPTTLYCVSGQLANGKHLPAIEVKADEFAASTRWLAAWGLDVLLEVPPRQAWAVPRAIQEMSMPTATRETIYTYSGWTHIEGKPAFLTCSGAMMADGLRADVRVELGHAGSNLRRYALPMPPAGPRLTMAIQHSLAFVELAPLMVTAPLLAAMYSAPLTSWRSLDTLIWVYGITQSKKSTLSMLALTHFGPEFIDGSRFYAPVDWVSTAVGIESALFTCKDLPVIIDDYAPQATEEDQRKLRQTAQRVIRTLGNRAGRARGNGDGSDRMVRPPRALGLATAEKTLEVQSTVGRMIEVPIRKGEVRDATPLGGKSPLTMAQEANGPGGAGWYALSMAGYIQYLAAHYDQAHQVMLDWLKDYQSKAKQTFSGDQSRLADSFATLMCGVRMFAAYASDSEAISPGEAESWHGRMEQALVDVLQAHSRSVNEQSPVFRLMTALNDLLTQERVYLRPRGGPALGGTGDGPRPNSVLVGWFDPSTTVVYLMSSACIQEARRYYRDLGEGFDTNTLGLTRELEHHGLLIKFGQGRNTYTGWMGDGNVNTVALDASRVHEKYGVMLYPPRREA